ncbi:AMIN-like domain-containing (lipo)protein [Streptomyces sp. NPDC003691]
MRRLTTLAAALAIAGGGLTGAAGAAPAPISGTEPSGAACSTPWGSAAEKASGQSRVPLRNIRTGRHACYDRMVFDLPGGTGATGFHVSYVDEFRQDFTGDPVRVAGGAVLEITVRAPGYDGGLNPTYPAVGKRPLPGVDVTGYRTFRDHRFGTSWEGQTQVGLGVRGRLPFRVVRTGNRVILDVAHTW